MPTNTFYTVVLSAAATLMGLLFVAVQFNMDHRGHKLGPGWLSLAKSTINIYLVLFLIPFVMLLPELQPQTRAGIILTLAVISVVRQFACWLAAWKINSESSGHIALRMTWLLLAPTVSFGVIGHSAIEFLRSNVSVPQERLSLAVLGLFIVALRNSWSLVLHHSEVIRVDVHE